MKIKISFYIYIYNWNNENTSRLSAYSLKEMSKYLAECTITPKLFYIIHFQQARDSNTYSQRGFKLYMKAAVQKNTAFNIMK
jgi:hypothetical protein